MDLCTKLVEFQWICRVILNVWYYQLGVIQVSAAPVGVGLGSTHTAMMVLTGYLHRGDGQEIDMLC